MDLVNVMRLILRRWYVVVAVMLATIVAALMVVTRAEPEYEAQAVVMLTGSNQQNPDTAEFDTLADPGIIAELAQGGEIRDEIESDVPYTVEVAGESMLRVTASARTPDGLAETVSDVMEAIEEHVNARQSQAGVLPELQVTTDVITTPDNISQVTEDGITSYEASGSVLLSPPGPASVSDYPPSSFTMRVLQARLESEDAVRQLWENGATAAFLTSFDARDAAPIMTIQVLGSETSEILHTVDSVIALMKEELALRQDEAGVSPATQTTVDEISVPTTAVLTSSNLLRPLVTVVGLGVVAALALAVFTEGMAQALTQRKHKGQTERASGVEAEPKAEVKPDDHRHEPQPTHAEAGPPELAALYRQRVAVPEDNYPHRSRHAGSDEEPGVSPPAKHHAPHQNGSPSEPRPAHESETAEQQPAHGPELPHAADAETVEFRLRGRRIYDHWSSQ